MNELECLDSQEEFDSELTKCFNKLEALTILEMAIKDNGISRDMVLGLEDIEKGIITKNVPVTAFTQEPSKIFIDTGLEGVGEGITRVLTAIGKAILNAYRVLRDNVKRILRSLFKKEPKPRTVNVNDSELKDKRPPKDLNTKQNAKYDEGFVEEVNLKQPVKQWIRDNEAAEAYAKMLQDGWWKAFPSTMDQYAVVNYHAIIDTISKAKTSLLTVTNTLTLLTKPLNKINDLILETVVSKGQDDEANYRRGEELLAVTQQAIATMTNEFENSEALINALIPNIDSVPMMKLYKEPDWSDKDIERMRDLAPGDHLITKLKALKAGTKVKYRDALPYVDFLDIVNVDQVDFSEIYEFAEKLLKDLSEKKEDSAFADKASIAALNVLLQPHALGDYSLYAARVMHLRSLERAIRENLVNIITRYVDLLHRVDTVKRTATKFAQEQGPKIAAALVK